jgi:hypothetical protein
MTTQKGQTMGDAKQTRRSIRYNADGVQVAAEVNIGTGAEGQRTSQHVTSHQRIVQRNGRTVVSEQVTTTARPPEADR